MNAFAPSTETPPPRLLRHPGPVSPNRWDSVEGGTGRGFRIDLEPGKSLQDAIVSALGAHGVRYAALNLQFGMLQSLRFCMTVAREGPGQVAAYADPLTVAGPLALVQANATLAENDKGQPLLHCHGLYAGPDGAVFGGHMLPDQTFIGSPAPILFARPLDGIEVRLRYDPETDFSVLQPAREDAHV